MGKYIEKFDRNDKFHFIAYNANFDDNFMRSFFKKNNDNYYGSWFYWPPLDVANLAGAYLANSRSKMINFKLMTVANFLGFEADSGKAHDALYDIETTIKVFDYLKRQMGL